MGSRGDLNKDLGWRHGRVLFPQHHLGWVWWHTPGNGGKESVEFQVGYLLHDFEADVT